MHFLISGIEFDIRDGKNDTKSWVGSMKECSFLLNVTCRTTPLFPSKIKYVSEMGANSAWIFVCVSFSHYMLLPWTKSKM